MTIARLICASIAPLIAPAESSLELIEQSNTRQASGSGHAGAADGYASASSGLPLD
jgi:hypothetical protein